MENLYSEKFKIFIQSVFTGAPELSAVARGKCVNAINKNIDLFIIAFTPERANAENNYRLLEFLGDGVMGCFLPWYLTDRFPQLQHPKHVQYLSKLKCNLASSDMLSRVARGLGFLDFLDINTDENAKVDALLDDVCEAFIGAAVTAFDREFGMRGVGYNIIYKVLKPMFDLETIELTYEQLYDAKTLLKELVDANRQLGTLQFVENSDRTTTVLLKNVKLATGEGLNKKIQHQDGAQKALDELERTHKIYAKTGSIFEHI